jgi:hypothetical protein
MVVWIEKKSLERAQNLKVAGKVTKRSVSSGEKKAFFLQHKASLAWLITRTH